MRQRLVSRTSRTPGGASGQLDERFVRVGLAVELGEIELGVDAVGNGHVAGEQLALIEREQVRGET